MYKTINVMRMLEIGLVVVWLQMLRGVLMVNL